MFSVPSGYVVNPVSGRGWAPDGVQPDIQVSAAQAFELAIAQPDAAIGEAFHVAAREPVTMRDYADAAASWFGREANLDFLPWQQWRETVSVRAAEITRDHVLHSPDASIAKARARLGFQPRYTVVGAAREAVSYLLTM